MPNALADETSPYLRQHADNPVDWLPWGPPAFARARALDRPLLVSIGYSACHWCHVMERESFADEPTAQLMNDRFVCIKVDREERPDVDALYMEAVQALTGQGGWPLNVFLTPEQLPFYGGTYFPPQPRHGMPSWTQVLTAIAEAWHERRGEIVSDGERLREHLARGALLTASDTPFAWDALEDALAGLRSLFDTRNGGFGGFGGAAGAGGAGGPRFPHASAIELLLLLASGERWAGAGEMASRSLEAMAQGGIYDQLGGGFHRYSVDPGWTVPHFEKMLYDQALLARAYLHAWQTNGDARSAEVCRQTLDWVSREMRGPEGGFYSALDADSDGVEGAYYVWTLEQLHDALGSEDAEAAAAWLGVTAEGNFEDGLCVLAARGPLPGQAARERIREDLLRARARRTKPALDDKRLTGWNALMIAALADAGASLPEPRYTHAAIACADFVLGQMRDRQGRLQRVHNGQQARVGAFLEDYAFLLEALLALFETTCQERWFHEAIAVAEELIARFEDSERGGFYSIGADAETLIVRTKQLEDTPIPAGPSSAALGLLRLAQLTGEARYELHALATMALVRDIAPRHPAAFGHALQAFYWHLAPARPIACAIPPRAWCPES